MNSLIEFQKDVSVRLIGSVNFGYKYKINQFTTKYVRCW